MPNSKQQGKGYGTAFYSRKYKKWFKTFENYQKYDQAKKKQWYYDNAENMVYSKDTGTIFSNKTGKIHKRM